MILFFFAVVTETVETDDEINDLNKIGTKSLTVDGQVLQVISADALSSTSVEVAWQVCIGTYPSSGAKKKKYY